jgi:hypothetical protein
MAITVSQLISDVQFLIDDSSVPTASQILRLLNRARKEVAKRAQCLEDECSFSSTAYAHRHTLPTDAWKIKDVSFWDIDTRSECLPIDRKRWEEIDQSQTDTLYSNYWLDGRTLRMSPRLSSGADATACNGAVGLTDATITVDDTTYFQTVGKLVIDSEVIYYSNKTSTTFTGCLRAQEGSTVATHANDAVVTERDIVVAYYKVPVTNLTTADSVEEQFTPWSDVLGYWMAWQAKIKDTDDLGSSGADKQAMMFRQMYEEGVMVMTNEQYTQDTNMTIREV